MLRIFFYARTISFVWKPCSFRQNKITICVVVWEQENPVQPHDYAGKCVKLLHFLWSHWDKRFTDNHCQCQSASAEGACRLLRFSLHKRDWVCLVAAGEEHLSMCTISYHHQMFTQFSANDNQIYKTCAEEATVLHGGLPARCSIHNGLPSVHCNLWAKRSFTMCWMFISFREWQETSRGFIATRALSSFASLFRCGFVTSCFLSQK